VDAAGPFQRATLTGLAAGTTYHYRIGDGGDHTLRAAPAGSFTSVDIGDTAPPSATVDGAATAAGAAQSPDFVTHGGDISYANECGVPAVHQLFQDVMAWSTSAAFQPAWATTSTAPPNAGPRPARRATRWPTTGPRPADERADAAGADAASKRSNPRLRRPAAPAQLQGDDWGWLPQAGWNAPTSTTPSVLEQLVSPARRTRSRS